MILQGKFNSATVYIDYVDNETVSQVINLCNQEAFKESSIKIMPDCHAGKGCTIGTTMTIKDKVVPNLVGVDIGCGMATIELDESLDLNKLDNVIRENIPHGFNIHSKSRETLLNNIFKIDLKKIKCNANIDRAFLSLGSLGGGNHFIEVDKNKEGKLFLTVHTGSRNLGKNIAEYYQKEAIKYCAKKYGNNLTSCIAADLKAKGQGNLIEKAIKEHKANNKKPQDDLCYLEGKLMDDYLHDMNIAQQFAEANRVVILADILFHYYDKDHSLLTYILNVKKRHIECIHNYIDMDYKILRKGAISAYEGKDVIIPINMRDGIIIGKGLGNAEWNYSAPHGAGRVLSRGKAKSSLSLEDFKKSMEGIFTTCVGQSTLDEAPQAYKTIDVILEKIGETVNVEEILKPIYNFKSN